MKPRCKGDRGTGRSPLNVLLAFLEEIRDSRDFRHGDEARLRGRGVWDCRTRLRAPIRGSAAGKVDWKKDVRVGLKYATVRL